MYWKTDAININAETNEITQVYAYFSFEPLSIGLKPAIVIKKHMAKNLDEFLLFYQENKKI